MEAGGTGGGEFGIGPAAFRADGEDGGGFTDAGKSVAERRRVGRFGEKDANAVAGRVERGYRLRERIEDWELNAAGLLRGFEKNFFPAFSAFCGGSKESFFAASRRQRDDAGDAELARFLDSPFEGVEFYYREKQGGLKFADVARELFEKCEVDAIACDDVDAAEPDGCAVAEFVELAGLRAEDAAEMVGGFALHDGVLVIELVDEEAAAHE